MFLTWMFSSSRVLWRVLGCDLLHLCHLGLYLAGVDISETQPPKDIEKLESLEIHGNMWKCDRQFRDTLGSIYGHMMEHLWAYYGHIVLALRRERFGALGIHILWA